MISEQRISEIVSEELHKLNEGIRPTGALKVKKNRNARQIEAYFKKEGVNCASYAYKLFRVKGTEGKDTNEMKNARGLFMKKLNHEPNNNGGHYRFSSTELNRLQSLISNAQLSEAVDKAVDSVMNEIMEKKGTKLIQGKVS